MKKEYELPNDIEEGKSLNIALVSSIFVVMLLVFLEALNEILSTYVSSYTPLLGKVAILGIFYFIIRAIMDNHEYLIKAEAFIFGAKKKKKK